MITKGIITFIDRNTNKIRAHIPLFDTAGTPTPTVLDCTVSYTPGNLNGYKEGDVVFISFENNQLAYPIILGKLYLKEDSSTSSNYSLAQDLKVSSKAVLPSDTVIGDITYKDLKDITNKTEKNVNEIKALQSVYNFSNSATAEAIEKEVGTWIDGQPMFRKTYKIDISQIAGESGKSWSYDFSIEDINFKEIWNDMTHTFINGGTPYSLNAYCTPTQSDFFNVYIDIQNKKVYLRGLTAGTFTNCYVTLEYTKNNS